LDRIRFGLLVPDRLYKKLETIVLDMKQHVADALNYDSALKGLNLDTSKVVQHIQNTLFRIPGAPRGSWAAIQRDFVDAGFTSETTPLKIALLQANALFQDRLNLAFDRLGHCTGPPIYDSLVTNAYVYWSQDCSHILLGLLRRPWADVRYDDESLYSRFGFVVAHELAHHTLASPYNANLYRNLTSEYSTSQRAEAIADIVAAIAVIRSGKIKSSSQICQHQTQVWCAREPVGYERPTTGSHPPANFRGGALCRSLRNIQAL
jgi:hypothetical protein